MPSPEAQAREQHSRVLKLATLAAILIGALVRLSVLAWADPWEPHHPDEHILPLEAMALWEGVTPREVGWPGSTTRLVLSAIAGSQLLAEEGRAIWALRHEPDRGLAIVSTWSARKYVDPRPLYRMGRTLSVVTGILQLIAVAWALSCWVGPAGTLVGTLAVAISPVTVAASQYVLADITGLLFGTIALGLAAAPTPRRVLAMAALVGLAASSKFHFGLWALTPLLCVWFGDRALFHRKWRLSLGVILMTAWVMVTLVPWFLMDPILALKEFGGVVLVKVGHGSTLDRAPRNMLVVFGGFGVLLTCGALAGVRALDAARRRRFAPVVIPLLLGSVALALMATVFDRYGLVLLPGAIVLAAVGWDLWLLHSRTIVSRAGMAVLGVCVVATAVSLFRSQQFVGDIGLDVLLRDWIVANVNPGSGVAVHDEMNAFLPRTLEQLRACTDYVSTAAAYLEKWRVEGVETSVIDTRPMDSLLLTDERFSAFWCSRELALGSPAGFRVVPYHDDRRFGAVLERDAINDFRTGGRQATGGVDVLVLNREVEIGMAPAVIFSTRAGRRVIYRR
jgi:hypothetical protein